ncbi:MAG: lipopolysaccharide biosynthesis protein [Deltaproteobacteria bacterium]|nr:lipopolysaccharide biosynthesis protein [Deltaproteobacteria bacterium]
MPDDPVVRMKASRLRKLVHFLLHPGDRLSQRVVHAGFWAFALRITGRLFGLARTIVLARVLSPNDFGLFGISLLALSVLNTFSQTGFQAALVQKKGDIKPYLDTAWTVQVIRGFVLAGILFGIAPYVASFFGEPMAAPLLRVLGLSAIFQGLTNIGVIYFQKELEFHKRFIYMFSGTLADLGVAIPAALILRNAWALVFGLLAGNFVRMAVSYFIHPYRPRVWLDGPKVKELYTFGKWILGSSVIVFLATQGDDIFLGKVLGATVLGLYQMAFRFSNLVATEITHVTSQVTFPAYSKLQDNVPKLREGFLRTIEAVTSVALPITAGILILAPDFVQLFLGEKWLPMVPALRILSISGLIRSVTATGGPLFQAVGRPNMDFWMNLGRVGVMAMAIYPLTKMFGMNGTATTVVLGISATIPVWWRVSIGIIKSNYAELLKALVPSLAGTSIMSLFMLSTMRVLGKVGFLDFGLLVLIAVIVYLAFQIFLWRRFHYGPIGSLQMLKRSL